METLATIAFSLGVIGYTVASTIFFQELFRNRTAPATGLAARALLVGAVAHGVHIVSASLFSRVCPVESVHFSLSSAALVSVAVFLWYRRRQRLDALGIIIGPLALTFLVAAQFIEPVRVTPGLSRNLLGLHVTANLLGVGLVLFSGAAALFYLMTEKRLKQKRRLAGPGRLPSLEALDQLSLKLSLLAFPFLSFGVVSGAVFASQLGQMSGLSFARAVLGYLTWFLVAAGLLARALLDWRGRRSALGILAGVVSISLVLVIYVFGARSPSKASGRTDGVQVGVS